MSPVLVNSIIILVSMTSTQASGFELLMYTSISDKTASLLLCVFPAKISNIMIGHWIDANIKLTSHTALAETAPEKSTRLSNGSLRDFKTMRPQVCLKLCPLTLFMANDLAAIQIPCAVPARFFTLL